MDTASFQKKALLKNGMFKKNLSFEKRLGEYQEAYKNHELLKDKFLQ